MKYAVRFGGMEETGVYWIMQRAYTKNTHVPRLNGE